MVVLLLQLLPVLLPLLLRRSPLLLRRSPLLINGSRWRCDKNAGRTGLLASIEPA
jgi:hypothetical protein